MDEAIPRSRRDVMGLLAGGLGLLAAAAAGIVGAGFLYPVPQRAPLPQFICLRSAISRDRPTVLRDRAGRKVLLMEQADGALLAIGTECTHLGCSVFYRPERGVFECPCHDGRFDAVGNPVSGPPSRPLPRFPVEVRDGKVFVQFS